MANSLWVTILGHWITLVITLVLGLLNMHVGIDIRIGQNCNRHNTVSICRDVHPVSVSIASIMEVPCSSGSNIENEILVWPWYMLFRRSRMKIILYWWKDFLETTEGLISRPIILSKSKILWTNATPALRLSNPTRQSSLFYILCC